jgi:hypothetical protein
LSYHGPVTWGLDTCILWVSAAPSRFQIDSNRRSYSRQLKHCNSFIVVHNNTG